ncbi:CsgG/HfaB family protein [Marinifilum fragile]|uniref:CsgG/HfaB family protein n=1 Tax=Marinifilum fragile TaxID=570161 RepID=UPI002AA65D77|nr:CsgG/HfaB family protein [Marinifilum fragile]
MKRFIPFYLLVTLIFSGCVPYFNQPLTEQRAEIGAETPVRKNLIGLPEPREKIVAAVYKFRDQTGQYKPSETGANWSTAVTQGTTSILLKAIEESGWFIPLEREGLNNLLNERKIIRSSRANYADKDDQSQLLPPLLFAGIVLEGGVISYDANVITGGAGLMYFAAGGSGQYRQDRVTVYLRAISTSNGRILKTVYTSKMILSQKVDASLFRYVKFKRLLEAETGFTYNEPSEMAVKEAIEKAVESLIIEGVIEGLWDLKNPEEVNSEVITKYVEEKEENQESDFFDQLISKRRHKFGLGIEGGSWLYMGDYSHTEMEACGGLSLLYDTQSFMQFKASITRGDLATTKHFQKTFNSLDVTAKYRLLPYKEWTPYVEGGFGLFSEHDKSAFTFDLSNSIHAQAIYGAGVEFLLNDRFGLNFSILNHYIFNDEVDGLKQGHYNDYFWEGKIGLNFYFDKLWDKSKKKRVRKQKIRKKPKEQPKSAE